MSGFTKKKPSINGPRAACRASIYVWLAHLRVELRDESHCKISTFRYFILCEPNLPKSSNDYPILGHNQDWEFGISLKDFFNLSVFEKWISVHGSIVMLFEPKGIIPVLTSLYETLISKYFFVGSFIFTPIIEIANINDYFSRIILVNDGICELVIEEDQLIISLLIVFIPRLVNKAAKRIMIDIEKKPPVAVL